MVEIVAAIVDSSKNIYYLSNNNLSLNVNDKVIIETDLGLFDARIIKGNYMEKEDNLVMPLKKVDRLVSEEDLKEISKLNSEEEYVTEWELRFGTVKAGFEAEEKPFMLMRHKTLMRKILMDTC